MISSRGLRYHYPRGPALIFPDLELPQGATLLLRGASGSGKSTWLALACGLLSATGGRISVAGQNLEQLGPAARDAWRARSIGFLPQKLHLSDALSVRDNVALAYFAAGWPQTAVAAQRVQHVLEQLGVADLARRRPGQLSGGQAQRVALARALLLQPRLILADEPTASLDDAAAAAALALLRESASVGGATLVIATHDRRVGPALGCVFNLDLGAQTEPQGA